MQLLGLWRKLGILRFGTKSGTYTSYRDRPDELFMDNVYDARQDLVHKEDVQAAARAVNAGRGRKIFYWVCLVVGVLFLTLFLLGAGLAAWFFLDLVVWAGFLWLAGQFAFKGRYSYPLMIFLAMATIVLSFLLLGVAAPR